MVQYRLFFISFLFIIFNYYRNYIIRISYFLGCDIISYGLILLSLWICSLILMASESVNKYNNYKKLYFLNILLLVLVLILTFSRISLFLFYLFFDRRLIPTLFLFLVWGYQPERLQAGVYLLFYTLLVSLPLLTGIFYLYNITWTITFYLLTSSTFNYELLYLAIICAFLV